MSRLVCALAFVALEAGLAVGQPSEPSPLVVKTTTDKEVHRVGRLVPIMLTETNTSDHGVEVATGCQILRAYATAQDGTVVWVFRDLRLCLTGQGTLPAGTSRTFGLTWNTKRSAPVVQVSPGVYTITAGVDGVSDSTVVRLRRRR